MATAAHMLTPLDQLSPEVTKWVESVRGLTQPRTIHWCDGSEAEARELTAKLVRDGELKAAQPRALPRLLPRPLESERRRARRAPDFRLHAHQGRRRPEQQLDGPGRGAREDARLFRGCMRGRTLYVIPYCMGPIDSPLCALRRRDHRQPLRRANMRS